jgi:hypothetical protein
MKTATSVAVVLCFDLCILSARGSQHKEASAVSAIVAHEEALQNVEVSYTLEESFAPSKTTQRPLSSGVIVVPQTRPKTGEALFRFSKGRLYYEWRNKQQDGLAGEFSYRILSFSDERSESLWKTAGGPTDIGKISSRSLFPKDLVIDVALGIRQDEWAEWKEPADAWRGMQVTQGPDGLLLARRPGAKGQQRDIVWTFDPKLGHALIRQEVFWEGQLARRVQNSDFRRVEQLLLPYRIKWQYFQTGDHSQARESRTKALDVLSYKVDVVPASESFLITYPEGAVVLDARTKQQFVIRGKATRLDDDTLQRMYAAGAASLERTSGPWLSWLLAVNVLVVGVIVGVAMYRRLGQRKRENVVRP